MTGLTSGIIQWLIDDGHEPLYNPTLDRIIILTGPILDGPDLIEIDASAGTIHHIYKQGSVVNQTCLKLPEACDPCYFDHIRQVLVDCRVYESVWANIYRGSFHSGQI